jgi:hypothetical protein
MVHYPEIQSIFKREYVEPTESNWIKNKLFISSSLPYAYAQYGERIVLCMWCLEILVC